MRLIDADALLKNGIKCSYGYNNEGVLLIPMRDVYKSIEDAPTVEDAVVVVRCKNCKHRYTFMCPLRYAGCSVADENYCSCGERKNGNI